MEEEVYDENDEEAYMYEDFEDHMDLSRSR